VAGAISASRSHDTDAIVEFVCNTSTTVCNAQDDAHKVHQQAGEGARGSLLKHATGSDEQAQQNARLLWAGAILTDAVMQSSSKILR
jgi:hypothetical protein